LKAEMAGRNHNIRAMRYGVASRVLRVVRQITNLTCERLWGQESQLPSQVQIAVNVNIVGLEDRVDD